MRLFGLSAVGFAFLATCPVHAQSGQNLIENPSFEEYVVDSAGLVDLDGTAVDLAGWTESGQLTLTRYDSPYGIVNPPPGSGSQALFGGDDATAVTQTVEVGSIIAGTSGAAFRLAAYLGSFNFVEPDTIHLDYTQDDYAVLTVTFRDALGADLGSAWITGPTHFSEVDALTLNEDGSFSGWFAGTGTVPEDAETVDIEVSFVLDPDADPGSFNNGNADLVEFRVYTGPADECQVMEVLEAYPNGDPHTFASTTYGTPVLLDYPCGLINNANFVASAPRFDLQGFRNPVHITAGDHGGFINNNALTFMSNGLPQGGFQVEHSLTTERFYNDADANLTVLYQTKFDVRRFENWGFLDLRQDPTDPSGYPFNLNYLHLTAPVRFELNGGIVDLGYNGKFNIGYPGSGPNGFVHYRGGHVVDSNGLSIFEQGGPSTGTIWLYGDGTSANNRSYVINYNPGPFDLRTENVSGNGYFTYYGHRLYSGQAFRIGGTANGQCDVRHGHGASGMLTVDQGALFEVNNYWRGAFDRGMTAKFVCGTIVNEGEFRVTPYDSAGGTYEYYGHTHEIFGTIHNEGVFKSWGELRLYDDFYNSGELHLRFRRWFDIYGQLTLTSTSTIIAEIAPPQGGWTIRGVTGNSAVHLDGMLRVTVAPGTSPCTTCDEYTLIYNAPITGEFDSIEFPEAPGYRFRYDQTSNSATIRVFHTSDLNDDGTVDWADFVLFEGCLLGPGQEIATGCEYADFDQDGDVTIRDFATLQREMQN